VQITPDTTESDLKQRREIVNKSLVFMNSSVVEAALKGHVLIIEGLELAERGVVTVLNNLLENREMHLEDGTFLTSAERYDALSESDIQKHSLVRVHPQFRVIVVGVPTPRYPGAPLDPPLRSRFQYKWVAPSIPPSVRLRALSKAYPDVDKNLLRGIVSFAATQQMQKTSDDISGIPPISIDFLDYVAQAVQKSGGEGEGLLAVLHRAFPFEAMSLDEPVVASIKAGLKWLNLTKEAGRVVQSTSVEAMQLDYDLGKHLLLVGEKGWGKTHLAKQFSERFEAVTLLLYEDMTARDLLQRRQTKPNGDTIWRDSVVVEAALKGGIVILDGVDQLKPGSIASIQRMIEDGEADLPDGRRIVSPERYQVLLQRSTPEKLKELRMSPMHKQFRLIGIGAATSKKKKWLSPHLISMFKVHVLESLALGPLEELLRKFASAEIVESLVKLISATTRLDEGSLSPLSLRQLLRLCKRGVKKPAELREAISVCYLSAFLPLATKAILEKILDESGFKVAAGPSGSGVDKKTLGVEGDEVVIGQVHSPRFKDSNIALIPQVRFYPVAAHIAMLESMLMDWNAGEHLLLIGNQGVGKNVLADKLLQMLNMEREYIQLHRDTTVQSLCLAPSLRGGLVVYEDSALIRAIVNGRCLIIDEIDKAPLEVVMVLKGLLFDGEMSFSDGRRCLQPGVFTQDPNVMRIHPHFRVIALANRPGFPFLGNNFFQRIGDCFAGHVVGNVDADSEYDMLQSYAPKVPEFLLRKLISLFNDLRLMVETGSLQHPYSMRELVQIAKHLNSFPNDSLSRVLQNVFAVDFANPVIAPILREVLLKHAIPIETPGGSDIVRRANWSSFQGLQEKQEWESELLSTGLRPGAPSRVVKHRPWKWRREYDVELKGRTESRISMFSELVFEFNMPPRSLVADCVRSADGQVHVLFTSPVQVLSYDKEFRSFGIFDLSVHLPYHRQLPVPPKMFTVRRGTLLAVFLPVYRMLLAIDFKGGYCTPIQVPPLDDVTEDASVFNDKMYPDAASLRGGAKQVEITRSTHDDILACFAQGSDRVCFIDLNSGKEDDWNQVVRKVPVLISKVVHFKAGLWFVYALDQQLFLLDNDQPSRWVGLSCVSNPPTRQLLSTCPWTPELFSAVNDFVVKSSDLKYVSFFPLSSGQEEVKFSRWISATRQVVLVLQSGRVLVVDPANNQSRLLAAEEHEEGNGVVCACVRGTEVFLIRQNGAASVYETDWDKLKAEEIEWRIIAGVPETSDGSEGDKLTLLVDGEEGEMMNEGEGEGEGEGSGSGSGSGTGEGTGKGEGSGGSGAGSGGSEGIGSGGQSGLKREGDAGPRTDEGLLDKEIDEAQRAMSRKALEEELELIGIGKYDLKEYHDMVDSVSAEVEQLKGVLLALEARGKERAWLKKKSSGDLDDTRLVESIVGEENVYKRRGKQLPKSFGPQEKPKRLLFLCDLSASMYRFNTQDQRLFRLVSLIVMLMEAFTSTAELREKYHFSIVGHSGDAEYIPLGVEFGAPPVSVKDKLAVVKKMNAHAEYCQSGDNSLECLKHGIQTIVEEESDDYFVLLISDANLNRYNVSPKEFGKELTKDPAVNAFALFIASFDGEAEAMKASLPVGKCHVTFDPSNLPNIFQQIFQAASFSQLND
jgi:MoxR-like ATPase